MFWKSPIYVKLILSLKWDVCNHDKEVPIENKFGVGRDSINNLDLSKNGECWAAIIWSFFHSNGGGKCRKAGNSMIWVIKAYLICGMNFEPIDNFRAIPKSHSYRISYIRLSMLIPYLLFLSSPKPTHFSWWKRSRDDLESWGQNRKGKQRFSAQEGVTLQRCLCCWHRGTWPSPQDPWAGSSERRATR